MSPRKKKAKAAPEEVPEITAEPFEEVPDVPAPPPRGSHLRVVKEFDLRAAHHAWKERNGIETDGSW